MGLTLTACGAGSPTLTGTTTPPAPATGTATMAAPPATGLAGLTPTTATYCSDGGTPQTLDVYEPAAAAAAHPLLIIVHGGSWAYGSSALVAQNPLTQMVVPAVLGRGFAVASINYRLAPADPWPAQIVDTRCAIRYLRATASRWHIDPERFAALGTSAGGHLVSVDALSDQQQPQWNSAQFPGVSSALQAVVDCWGPADLAAPGWGQLAVAIGRPVFGVTVGSQADVLRLASPVSYVHRGAPPFLIIQGTSDALVPPQQSVELQSRLRSAGDQATLLEVANAGHELRPSGGQVSPPVDALAQRVVAYLSKEVG